MKHGEAGPFQLSSVSDVGSILELVTDSQRCAARTVQGALLDRGVMPGGAPPTYESGSTLIERSHVFHVKPGATGAQVDFARERRTAPPKSPLPWPQLVVATSQSFLE